MTAFFGILSLPFTIPLRGWALSMLWAWFLVPLGAPPLSVAQACGVSLLVAYLTYTIDTAEQLATAEQKQSLAATRLCAAWLTPPLIVGFGAVIRWWL